MSATCTLNTRDHDIVPYYGTINLLVTISYFYLVTDECDKYI